jgi:hypothetical protein
MFGLNVFIGLLLLPSVANAVMVKNYAQVLNDKVKFKGLGVVVAKPQGYQFLMNDPEADLIKSDIAGHYGEVHFADDERNDSNTYAFEKMAMKPESELFDSKNNKFTYLLSSFSEAYDGVVEAVFFEKKGSKKQAKEGSDQGPQLCALEEGKIILNSCLKLETSKSATHQLVHELRGVAGSVYGQDEVAARLVVSKEGSLWEVNEEQFPSQRGASFAALVLGFSALNQSQPHYLKRTVLGALLTGGLLVAGLVVNRYHPDMATSMQDYVNGFNPWRNANAGSQDGSPQRTAE